MIQNRSVSGQTPDDDDFTGLDTVMQQEEQQTKRKILNETRKTSLTNQNGRIKHPACFYHFNCEKKMQIDNIANRL